MTTSEKTCFKCHKTLPLEAFYKHSRMSDGHLNKCKDCAKSDVLVHRQNNLERIRAYDRQRERKLNYAYTKEYRESNPEVYKAHNAVNNAIARGKLCKQPCFVCGNQKVEAHHPDYSSPLDVVWLCTVCHKQTHLLAVKIA